MKGITRKLECESFALWRGAFYVNNMDERQFRWKISTGYGIDVNSGMLSAQEYVAATFHIYHAKPGDRLCLLDEGYEYMVALYDGVPDLKYIYTYDYEPEENWTTYRGNLTKETYTQEDTLFGEDVYFRVILRVREGKKVISSEVELENILKWVQVSAQRADIEEPIFAEEINKTAEQILASATEESLSFFLLSDTHYTIGGTWDDTIRNISSVNGRIRANGCIHLGDATDGLGPKGVNVEYVRGMQKDFEELNLPLYYCVGNHDSNYFRNNSERFSRREMYDLYLKDSTTENADNIGQYDGGETSRNTQLWYYKDMPEHKLRMIFLESFDPKESVRYGFSESQLDWLEEVLEELSDSWYTVIFSHVPPIPRMHYWSNEIRGSVRLTSILRRYQHKSGKKLMGFIHGHNHADAIDIQEGFPVISVGCAKCEYFEDKKPEGSRTYYRELNTVSQELWDVLMISTEQEEMRFVRFGAGEDRMVGCGEKFGLWSWGEMSEDRRKEARIPMRKVITYGTFDLFHEGHYNLLKRAKALGDYLIVGVTTEHFDEQRGKINVVDSMLERIENVRKCGFADEIIIEDHEGQKIEDIPKYGVDVFTLGSDWRGMYDYLKEYCEVIYLERTPDISSTMLRSVKFPIVRLGVVGTGRIAPRFIAEAKYVSGLNVQSAYNPHRASVEAFAKRHELEPYWEAFGTFLNSVDAIYIASPHETHYEYTKQAILKGKHVLCEKPMSFTKKEAAELFALAKENGVVVMEGIKTAYCPGFAQLIDIAKSGKIGEIVDVEACFSRLTPSHLREVSDAKYGGAFLEFGSYTVLPIVKLLGLNYKDVKFSSILAENGVDLYTKVYFDYTKAMATSKTGVGVKSEGQLLISGTKGYILAESPWWLTKKFQVRYEDPNQIETYTPKFWGDGLRYEISEFISRINGRSKHPGRMTEEESIAMTDVVERFMEERRTQREQFQKRNRESGVKIWAHRGCSYQCIENTLPAFAAACKLPGIAGIELDVQLSKDGEIVVFHDETLDRLMDKSGNLRDYTLAELQAMKFKDCGGTTGNAVEVPAGKMLVIPTMRQVLELVKPYALEKGIRINIELKNGVVPYDGMEEKILALVKEYGMEDYVVYSSFNANSLKLLKELDGSVEAGILHGDIQECSKHALVVGADALHPNADSIEIVVDSGKKAEQPAGDAMVEKKPDGMATAVRAWNSREPFYKQDRQYVVYDLSVLKAKGVTDFITNVPEEYLEIK